MTLNIPRRHSHMVLQQEVARGNKRLEQPRDSAEGRWVAGSGIWGGGEGQTGGGWWQSCTATGFRDQAQQVSELRCEERTRRRA